MSSVVRAFNSKRLLRTVVASSLCRPIFTSPLPDIRIPNCSFNDHVLSNVDVYKDRVALVDGITGMEYKYSDLKDIVHRVASALTRRGFGKGDVLTMFVENSVEAVMLYHGVLATGGVVHLVNSSIPAAELSRQLAICGSRLLVATTPQAEIATKVAGGSAGRIEDVYIIGESVPHGCRPGSDLLEADNGGASPWGQLEYSPDDVVLMPHSSGTGGLPKMVQLTNHSLVANIEQGEDVYSIRPDEETLVGLLPFTHIYSVHAIFGQGLRRGAKIVTLPKFDPKLMLETMEKYRVTLFNVVPPILLFLLQSPMTGQFDLSFLERCSSSAAPLLTETHRAFQEKFQAKRPDFQLFQGYGLTETSPGLMVSPRRKHMPGPKYGSVGQLLPNTECRIINVDTNEEVGIGEEGELVIRGPQIMKGYLNAPKDNETMIKNGWLHTGDIGMADEDGYFYVTDRIKELIKYKGHQVAPAELEALLLTHPCVKDSAVVGKPDERAGEVPMAFVVKKGEVDAVQLQDFVASYVSEKSQIRGGVVFVDAIPKSPSGKVLRRILREQMKP